MGKRGCTDPIVGYDYTHVSLGVGVIFSIQVLLLQSEIRIRKAEIASIFKDRLSLTKFVFTKHRHFFCFSESGNR